LALTSQDSLENGKGTMGLKQKEKVEKSAQGWNRGLKLPCRRQQAESRGPRRKRQPDTKKIHLPRWGGEPDAAEFGGTSA